MVFVGVFTLAGFLRPGSSPIHQAISDLGVGPNGWLLDVSTVITGLLLMGFAVGFTLSMQPVLSQCKVDNEMGGLLKILTIQWAAKTSKSRQHVCNFSLFLVYVAVCSFYRSPTCQNFRSQHSKMDTDGPGRTEVTVKERTHEPHSVDHRWPAGRCLPFCGR
jgi:hypothetical protein